MTLDNNIISQLEGLGISTKAPTAKKNDELGQDEFLELMITQLKNQDPLKPMENGEFLTQIAQFSSVTGISELQDSFAEFASSMQSNLALQASSMVGRAVLVPHNGAIMNEQGMSGAVELTHNAERLVVGIYSPRGELIQQMDYGPQAAGMINYQWDGTMSNGQQAGNGIYQIRAEATSAGQTVSLANYSMATVDSVVIGQGGSGLTLNLGDLGTAEFSMVKEIM